MNILFLFFYLVILHFFWKRAFDFFSIVFIASSAYFMPAAFGFSHNGAFPHELVPLGLGSYLFYFSYFTVLLCVAFKFDSERFLVDAPVISFPVRKLKIKRLYRILRVVRVVAAMSLFLSFIVMGEKMFVIEKQDFLNEVSNWFVIWQCAALLYLLIAFAIGRKLDIVVGVFYCFFDLYIGFRGITLFSVLSIVLYYSMADTRRRKIFPAITIGLIFLFVLLSIYKALILFVKLSDLQEGYLRFLDEDLIFNLVISNESFSQAAILDSVLISNFSLPVEHFFAPFRVFLPYVNIFIFGKSVGFNDYFQPVLFPEISWGMASNLWAEQYALAGWLGVYSFMVAFLLLVYFVNKRLLLCFSKSKFEGAIFLIYLMVPVLFLMHRNDLEFQFLLLRNYFLLWLSIVFIARVRLH